MISRTTLPLTLLAVLAVLSAAPGMGRACTNFLITRGATVDNSTMITYAADSHELYGELYYRPEATHPPGAKAPLTEWDTGKPIGSIPQVRHTFSVVGNMNEHQVSIGETTFGGRKELTDPKGGMDYGSLIWITLQRARTAREAIGIMGELVAAHGYMSAGESFSIADPKEVWLMELIGKGPKEKGAVWVARRVPDGYVTAHANMARIRTFPLKDPENCLYAKDVISFARKKGYFKGPDDAFSFRDAYVPARCSTLRGCDGRVWAMFHRVAPSLKIPADYILCKPGAPALPLWVKPDKKLSVADVAGLMRDHFEGTVLDMSTGPGSGPFRLPYRWRPMTWTVDGKNYMNERATATQQTGFSFIAQARADLPGPIGGLLWFSVDDMDMTVYVPMYAGITTIPRAYAVGTGSFTKFSWDSAFWTFTFVSNFAYSRYADMIVDIRKVQKALEGGFQKAQAPFEAKAAALYKRSPAKARALLTAYSGEAAQKVVTRWQKLGQELLMKYMDGNVRDAKGQVTHPPYAREWYSTVVKARPDHFRLPDKDTPMTDAERLEAHKAMLAKKAAAPPVTAPGTVKPTASVAPGPPAPRCPEPAPRKGGGCLATNGTRGYRAFIILGLLLVAVIIRLKFF